MMEGDDTVFQWLGEGSPPDPRSYLRLLGPGQGELARRAFANLETVSTRLRDRPDYWRELIRARNWRYTLVGYAALMAVRETRFLDDLLYRYREGSWVAPQLAVALGLVHPAETLTEFEAVIREPEAWTDVKPVFSAYAVLKLMGCEVVREFEASDLFRRAHTASTMTSHEIQDSRVGIDVVHSHWKFWTSRSFS
jgi:hypothetical protein